MRICVEEEASNPLIIVMNSTCIYLRAKDLNIYMYTRERIYKEPPEEIQ
jgi:hypothetical protein